MSAELVVTCVLALSSTTYKEPPSLGALRDCHRQKIERASAAYLKKKGQAPPDELFDAWDDVQREETRAYLDRHPDRASVETGATLIDASSEPAREIVDPGTEEAIPQDDSANANE